MAHESIRLPKFETYDDLMLRMEEAEGQVDMEARTLLGEVKDKSKARGRALMMAKALRKHPESSFYTIVPVADMQTGPKGHQLTKEQRMHRLAVNEKLLEKLYDEAGVDLSERTEELIDQGHGRTLKEVVYPTNHRFAFVENWTYGYKQDPELSLPSNLEVFAFTLRDGRIIGRQFLNEHSDIRFSG